MYLSKLELHGFKSFAQRTTVHFDPGVTAIVGPNGCGKSNIVDAVRWVIGEQRARILRSEKMEHIIFNGAGKRRPLGMAEVLLTVENTRGVLPTEYSEVVIGRRLYRSGDSEYLLNGVRCRLQDITDLFMDTGMGAGAYSVIELKMIEEILSENAQDRRRLFEEAAGITRYKLRRKQALGKLDTTQADLTRLRDVTDEVEKQVRTLKRQAEKAARHRDLHARLAALERALAAAEHARLAAQQATLRAEQEALQAEHDTLRARQAVDEADVEALRAEALRLEEAAAAQRHELHRRQEAVRAAEAEGRLFQERLEASEREAAQARAELADAAQGRARLEASAERLQAEQAAAAPALAAAEAAFAEARARGEAAREAAEDHRDQHHALRDAEERHARALAAEETALGRLLARLDLLGGDAERLRRERARQAADAEPLAGRRAEAEAALAALLARADEARAAVAEAERLLGLHRAQQEAAAEALQKAERLREATAAEARVLQNLVASYEEFSDAVRYLATAPEWAPAEMRTVADLVACDEADRLALQAALGELASCLVVPSDREAAAALALLRDRRKGQATFFVLDRLRPAPPSEPPVFGAADWLPARVRVSEARYEPLVAALLYGVYVVDTLDEAEALAREAEGAARFIARTGEWADAQGLVQGGSRKKPSTVGARLGRREQLAALTARLGALEPEIAERRALLEQVRREIRETPFEARRAELARLERARAEAEKTAARLAFEQETLEKRLAELDARAAEMQRETEAGRGQAAEREQAAARARAAHAAAHAARAHAEEALRAAEAESRLALSRSNEAHVAFVQAQNRAQNAAREQAATTDALEALARRTREAEARLARAEAGIAEARLARRDLYEQLNGLQDAQNLHHARLEAAEQQVQEGRIAIAEAEARLRQVRRDREALGGEAHARALLLAEVETRRADLAARLAERYGPDALRDAPSDEAADEAAARAEAADLRRRIDALGAVNALALEEYEQAHERFTFLTTQQADLRAAEATLLSAIREINTTAAQRFRETYAAIEAHFQDIFGRLFGEEASASLVLERPDDPLESAIEILARPRGKRPSAITQLSGGEKTLTAIALLFAIYLVKPSPFCILDEVDAPLDDANVQRFMALIRTFSRETQFILVTHNKRTMEAADRMYGVTMQEQGVSTLVGVAFEKEETA